ncbi:hypothetical protein RI103_32605 [Paraburkholderia sp. FT54]|uniref:hypothetical protein n=1 Tax=Paraburkholderia sp. FT54 TaxID=3074437 RepID=UPI002877FDF0|nr:hypothetical protein [Paraburkholderia sp. FT54]WNC92952.1 hypothetical protein RI103_32605 [Paraburkholderia sp. FT54]
MPLVLNRIAFARLLPSGSNSIRTRIGGIYAGMSLLAIGVTRFSPRVRALADWLVEVVESAAGMVKSAAAPRSDSPPWPVLDSTHGAVLAQLD